uniref:Catechol O-methyltransferase n=1 Tax=Alexandrium monilatum TaxID=311494 RepID=A0A7S4QFG0_9DINO
MERSCPFEDLGCLFKWCHLPQMPQVEANVDMKFDVRTTPDGKARGTHAKFANLASYVVAAEVDGAEGLLAAIAAFADSGALGGLKSYLKIAGSRADKLMEAVRSRPARGAEVAVEYGAFIGTTAVRLADCASEGAAREGAPQQRTVQVVSFEVEPVHVILARWVIDLAGLSWAAEVWPGIGNDVARRVGDEFGQLSWRIVFFDHRGTKYHEDLAQLEWLQLLAPQAAVIADNVLRPGAPQFLWHVHASAAYESVNWAFMDNTPFPGEDWLTVATHSGSPEWRRSWPPPSLERLSWDSDRWRRKSQEGGLRASDWSAFANHAAEELAQCGIEAQPWFDPNAPPQEEDAAGPAPEAAEAEGAWPEEPFQEPRESAVADGDPGAGELGQAAADVDAGAGEEGFRDGAREEEAGFVDSGDVGADAAEGFGSADEAGGEGEWG